MMNIILRDTSGNPLWIDISNPTIEELEKVKNDYNLHQTSIEDCMEAGHLPKIEILNGAIFIIMRGFDEASQPEKHSVTEITRKLAFFLGDRYLITVHRSNFNFLDALIAKYSTVKTEVFLQIILMEIMLEVVETYYLPIVAGEEKIYLLEGMLIEGQSKKNFWINLFKLKRRLTVMKRMLWHTLNTVQKYRPHSTTNEPLAQDIRERIENLHFFADGLIDDLNDLQAAEHSLTNNKLNLSSTNANHVMKLLAGISLFFLPINFIVGVYGMNFPHMPEFTLKYGYYYVWLLIISVEVVLFTIIWKKGWLKER